MKVDAREHGMKRKERENGMQIFSHMYMNTHNNHMLMLMIEQFTYEYLLNVNNYNKYTPYQGRPKAIFRLISIRNIFILILRLPEFYRLVTMAIT